MQGRYLLLLVGLLGKSLVSLGQQNANLPGFIPSVFYRGHISNRFDYNIFASTTIAQAKSTADGKAGRVRESEIYLQPSLVYKYSKELNMTAGYTFIRTGNFPASAETEQQVWQQIIFEHGALRGAMLHRFRMVENINANVSPSINYQFAFEKPLQGRMLEEGEFYFTCFNESFINLSPGASRIYPANWSFAGIGYMTSRAGKLEVGPLVQTTFHNQTEGRTTLYLLQILWTADLKILHPKR